MAPGLDALEAIDRHWHLLAVQGIQIGILELLKLAAHPRLCPLVMGGKAAF
jgi:hypothetical protein